MLLSVYKPTICISISQIPEAVAKPVLFANETFLNVDNIEDVIVISKCMSHIILQPDLNLSVILFSMFKII